MKNNEKTMKNAFSVMSNLQTNYRLSHWGRVTQLCVGKLIIIGSDNGLSPERRQATIWINAGILLIRPLGTNFSDILIEIQTFLLKKICLKMSSAKCCSFRLGLNVLRLDFAKNGTTHRRQMINPWHQTPRRQSVATPGTPLSKLRIPISG